MLWERIRDTLGEEIAGGRYAPGERLPSEAQLASRFGVNRHTVRRALQTLREEGRIHVRRGAGATVTEGRLDYRLTARTRFSRNILEAGHAPEREVLRIETVRASRTDALLLGIAPGARVAVLDSVGSADGLPLVYATSVFPVDRLPGIAARLAVAGISEALAAEGAGDYRRLWTRLTAERADPLVARHLRLPETAPVLRAESLDVGRDGRPVGHGRSWFCSDRIALVVEGGGLSFRGGEVAPAAEREPELWPGTGCRDGGSPEGGHEREGGPGTDAPSGNRPTSAGRPGSDGRERR